MFKTCYKQRFKDTQQQKGFFCNILFGSDDCQKEGLSYINIQQISRHSKNKKRNLSNTNILQSIYLLIQCKICIQ